MKVKEIKEVLSKYGDDDELIVEYWDKSFIEFLADIELSDDSWAQVVKKYERGEFSFIEDWNDEIEEIISEVVGGQGNE